MNREPSAKLPRRLRGVSTFDPQIVRGALGNSLRKLDPRIEARTPVMFVVWLGAVGVTVSGLWNGLQGRPVGFEIQVAFWLWLTCVFANFAESLAEGRGKAVAESLRRTKTETVAKRVRPDGSVESVPAAELQKGDLVAVEVGGTIPADGTVEEGIASVDESAVTGESAPVIRESGGDRSAVTGGTRVLSDRIVVRVTAQPGTGFLDRMIALVEGATRQKTPNEVALVIFINGMTALFLFATVTLVPFAAYIGVALGLAALVSLVVCLIPTTIGGLLSAIGIAGMDRLLQANVIAKSGRAVEAAGDVDVILLDKTGTITLGNRQAMEFLPAPGVAAGALQEAAWLASCADETPEGRSIVALATLERPPVPWTLPKEATVVPFTAETRMSGVDLPRGRVLRKGAPSSVSAAVHAAGGSVPSESMAEVERISRSGGTPLLVADGSRILGVVHLKDVVKPGIPERLKTLQNMGVRTVMVTGDNPITAATIAREAGVDAFMAQALPEDKLEFIREEQAKGHLVAMVGDGTNDAPALAQSDVGIAMNTGTQAAREAGNMVDLDSSPTKLLDVIEVGKQTLMARGALTTFSVMNDVAKYFAILPAMFQGVYPTLGILNVMKLSTPASAILSAVIFNTVIIVLLLPIALRGVRFKPAGAAAVLRRNLLLYGVGGVLSPFVGIKAIDLLVVALGLA